MSSNSPLNITLTYSSAITVPLSAIFYLGFCRPLFFPVILVWRQIFSSKISPFKLPCVQELVTPMRCLVPGMLFKWSLISASVPLNDSLLSSKTRPVISYLCTNSRIVQNMAWNLWNFFPGNATFHLHHNTKSLSSQIARDLFFWLFIKHPTSNIAAANCSNLSVSSSSHFFRRSLSGGYVSLSALVTFFAGLPPLLH